MRILLLCLFVSFSCYAQELPIKAFGALPAASQVKLSPDGQMLAYKGNLNGQSFIASVDLSSGEKSIWSLLIIKSSRLVGIDGPITKQYWLAHILLCKGYRSNMGRVAC